MAQSDKCTHITLVCVMLLMITAPVVSSEDTTWTQERYDSYNSGYVHGHGLLEDPVEMYTVSESIGLNLTPVVADIDGNGMNELLYTTYSGLLVIRNSRSGELIKTLSVGSRVPVPPLVADLNGDGYLDIIIGEVVGTNSVIKVLDGRSHQVFIRIDIPGQHINACGRIHDIDDDDRMEYIFPTFDGFVCSVDLGNEKIDWIESIAPHLRLPVGIIETDGGDYIVVTSGIRFPGMTTFGSDTIFFLDSSGQTVWKYGSFGTICTPPVVIESEGSHLIAYGTFPGNVYVLDFEGRTLRYEMNYTTLEQAPYWRYLSGYRDETSGRVILSLQGDRCCAALDVGNERRLWIYYFKYPTNIRDAILCDIDGDNRIEMVCLNESRRSGQPSTLVIRDLRTGTNETMIRNLPDEPYAVIAADLDNDDWIDICLGFNTSIRTYGVNNYVNFVRVDSGDTTIHDEMHEILYSMYEPYSIEVHADVSAPTDLIQNISVTFDQNSHSTKIQYLPFDGNSTVDTHHLILINTSLTRDRSRIVTEFIFMVNWSFPNEDFFDVEVSIRFRNGFERSVVYQDVFRVENDIEVNGKHTLHQNGSQYPSDHWFNSRDQVLCTGLDVTYEDSPDRIVDPVHYRLELEYGDHSHRIDPQTIDGLEIFINISGLDVGKHMIQINFGEHPQTSTARGYQFEIWIDDESPGTLYVSPDTTDWYSSSTVMVSVLLTDFNGSGIDDSTVQVLIGKEAEWETATDWNSFDSTEMQDNGSILFSKWYTFTNGIYLFEWTAADIAGNPISYSRLGRIKIDTISVSFSDQFPRDWQNTNQVETGVTITFGTNLTSQHSKVEYAYGDDQRSFESWNTVEDNVNGRMILQPTVELVFIEGIDNFIQWRVYINETSIYYSDVLRVRVDTISPIFGEPEPDLTDVFDDGYIDVSITIIDSGSGVDGTTIAYQFTTLQDFPDEWTPLEPVIVDDTISVIISFQGLEGKQNLFRLRATDVSANPYSISPIFNILVNEPPHIMGILPENGTHFIKGEEVSFNVEIWDPDASDTISVRWSSHRDGLLGEGINFSKSDLSVGEHVIHITLDDGHGHVTNDQFILIIDPPPDERTGGNWILVIVIIIVIAIIISLIYNQRRK